MAGDAAIAGRPVAGRQVEQHQRELVAEQRLLQVFGRRLVGELDFHRREAGARGAIEALQQRRFSEQHRQVGGEFGHEGQDTPPCRLIKYR
jgi:hypothetical protein